MIDAPATAHGADLTDDEVAHVCRPLKQHAAMVRYLRDKLHLHVDVAPDGRPLVNRAHYNAVRAGARASAGQAQNAPAPAANLSALQAWAAKRKGGGRGKAA